MIKASLEKDILQYGLLVGIGYQLYQSLISLVPLFNVDLALLNILITLVMFFLFLLAQKKGAHPAVLLSVHMVCMTGFTYFWVNFGGITGTVPSFFCIYISFIIVCSHGITRWAIIFILTIVLIVYFIFPHWLGMESIFEADKINPIQRSVDYLIVGGLIVLFTLYTKRKFVFYRERVSKRYKQLDQIATTLHEQNQELATRQEETRAINENLESMVENRTHEIEDKNKAMSEYAFINAHMLRGPLCRIIGLIGLMEREPDQYPKGELAQLKSIAQEIDQRVKEINSVIS